MRIVRTECVKQATQAFPFIADLDRFYPALSQWYESKVIPGLSQGENRMLLAWEGETLAGLVLGKVTSEERKLRCIRVAPDWQNTGLGLRLIERMFDELETATPSCTVAEEMLHQYSRPFINRYGFELSAVDKGRYRPRKLEYAFNGG